jgi:hypothetical protein
MTTDRGRQCVYDAEGFALGGTMFDDPWPWDRLVTLCDAVVAHPWWIGLGVDQPVLRPARRDARRSSADGTTIRLAADGRTVLTLVHELSHHVVIGLGLTDQGHGGAFRAAELRLTELIAGSEARRFLHQAWSTARLDVALWCHGEPPPGRGLVAELAAAPRRRIAPIALGPIPSSAQVPG